MRATSIAFLTVPAALLAAPASAAWPGLPTPPPPPQPRVNCAAGPPPAWLETHTRSAWLAFSSYCWKQTCADYLPPQSRTDLPLVRVRRGARVRIHFAFAPSQVHATTFSGMTFTHVALKPARVVNWRPTRAGVVSFDVRAGAGSTSYLVRVLLR